jgi:hypothetical protein
MLTLAQILMSRDSLTIDEAEELIADAKQRVLEGENPEDILLDEFGLEADYIFDLL